MTGNNKASGSAGRSARPVVSTGTEGRRRPVALRAAVFFVGCLVAMGLCQTVTGQTVTFDFDTGTPALSTGRNLPLSQTSGGVTAQFTAVSGAFSIQTDSSTGFRLSQFSKKYLYPGALSGGVLRVQFSSAVTDVGFDFATTDNPAIEIPTRIILKALLVTSTATNTIGSVTNRGSYGADTFPMGTIAFSGGKQPFNCIEVKPIPGGPSTFLLDNIKVTLLPKLSIRAAGTNAVVVSWPSSSAGFVLQGNAVPGPANWADVGRPVDVVNGENQVSISPAEGVEFYRLSSP